MSQLLIRREYVEESVGAGGQPDCQGDDRSQSEDPEEEALGDGAEVAELHAARRRVVLEVLTSEVMMSRLSSGVRLASLNTGMFCGPVTMAS